MRRLLQEEKRSWALMAKLRQSSLIQRIEDQDLTTRGVWENILKKASFFYYHLREVVIQET